MSRFAYLRSVVAMTAAGFVILLVIAATALWLVSESARQAELSRHADDVRSKSLHALTLLQDAETGQRGYLLSDDMTYLAPLVAARPQVEQAMVSLRALLADNPLQIERLAKLEAAIRDKFAEIDGTLRLWQGGDRAGALALAKDDSGKEAMGRIRTLVSEFVQAEEARVRFRIQKIEGISRWLNTALTGAAAIVVLLGLLTGILVYRESRRAEKARRDLQTLNLSLEDKIRARTSDLEMTRRRFEIALRGSNVIVFTQDNALRYTWISHSVGDVDAIGRMDEEIEADTLLSKGTEAKREAIETGRDRRVIVSGKLGEAYKTWELFIDPLPNNDGIICAAVDITELKRQENHLRLLMRELAHRSKNLLSVIQAIARQTASTVDDKDEFLERFSARLQGLASSHSLLVEEQWRGVEIQRLIRSQMGHFVDQRSKKIHLSGPSIFLSTEATQHLGLALHELATNAAKYGALSSEAGSVDITWNVLEKAGEEAEDLFTLEWRERDGPEVVPPSRKGFGRIVIERTVARALRGTAKLDYEPSGVIWKLTAPFSAVADTQELPANGGEGRLRSTNG